MSETDSVSQLEKAGIKRNELIATMPAGGFGTKSTLKFDGPDAPPFPGQYEVRYKNARGETLARSKAFTVHGPRHLIVSSGAAPMWGEAVECTVQTNIGASRMLAWFTRFAQRVCVARCSASVRSYARQRQCVARQNKHTALTLYSTFRCRPHVALAFALFHTRPRCVRRGCSPAPLCAWGTREGTLLSRTVTNSCEFCSQCDSLPRTSSRRW